MNRLAKYLSVYLVAILVVPTLLLFAKPIDAQTIPKPSVPKFSVSFVDQSYDVQAPSQQSASSSKTPKEPP